MDLDNIASDEKVYRFISDPGHKENLSGRVRAACVTCRRKKIKCSGEVPCSTCEERGIVCEGLTERKRPKRTNGRRSRASSAKGDRRSSRDSGAGEDGSRSQRHSFDLSSVRNDPNDDSAPKLEAQDSEDSGYGSGLQSVQGNISTRSLQLETRLSLNYSFATSTRSSSTSAVDVSPSGNDFRNWSFLGNPGSTNTIPAEPTNQPVSRDSGVNPASAVTGSMDWTDPGTDGAASTKLLSAAQALEEQALSLRQLASHSDKDPADEARRHTITFPFHNEPVPPSDSANQLFSGCYDDYFLATGTRTLGTGLTPLPLDFNEMTAAEWTELSDLYNMASNSVESGDALNESTKLHNPTTNSRHFSQMYRTQAQHGYGNLYPWPE